MGELYERLLSKINAIDWAVRMAGLPPEPLGSPDATTLADALRAVLELHKPFECDRCPDWHCPECGGLDDHCDTVRAIARALDVPIGGDQQ